MIKEFDVGYGEPEIGGLVDKGSKHFLTGIWQRPSLGSKL
jgi:hypothetical protein